MRRQYLSEAFLLGQIQLSEDEANVERLTAIDDVE
jgi:hypothetical protein